MPRTSKRTGDAQESASQATPPPAAPESAGALISQEPANHRDTTAAGSPAVERAEANAPATGATQLQAETPTFVGLRGADYVQALAGQPSTTLQVPLLPNERRGDWGRAKGQKIAVTARQIHQHNGSEASWLERDHALAALIVELQRPGATRFDQIDLKGSPARTVIDRLGDYLHQARLRAQTQTSKKWNATHLYLVPVEDA